MGQAVRKIRRDSSVPWHGSSRGRLKRFPSFLDPHQKFPDIVSLPPEIALMVLSNLNATDLCLAMTVNDFWRELASDEMLWQGLCRATWGCISAYDRCNLPNFSWKALYMHLDEASVTFNADPDLGLEYLTKHGLIDGSVMDIAQFIHTTNRLHRRQVRDLLSRRQDILEVIINLDNYSNKFLPNALRTFFSNVDSPRVHSRDLHSLIQKFAERFIDCNPDCGLTKDGICILCYSLIILSVDLTSPHVKNKMSKREFIRNVRQATNEAGDELAGHLYDNIYLVGHIAPERWDE
ncbi:F-box only protein 8-like [Diadema setosum]|uniref:F-box only protein 8-like n=1 Tax=Diadema setosum TaxID=31175 RepID=UPI003B3BA78C